MSRMKDLIEKYRHINVDYDDWYLPVYEACMQKMDSLGIDVTRNDMLFSGFWSQGDGASFSGYIHRDNMKKFMDEHALNLVYPACYFFANLKELSAKLVRTGGHYCHENTVRAKLVDDYIANNYDDDDPRYEIYEAMTEALNKEYADFEEKIQTICRGWMKYLYRALEDEYDYLTSDDAVIETLEANDMLDLINGEGAENGVCGETGELKSAEVLK